MFSSTRDDNDGEGDSETEPLEISDFFEESDDLGVEIDVEVKFGALSFDAEESSRDLYSFNIYITLRIRKCGRVTNSWKYFM